VGEKQQGCSTAYRLKLGACAIRLIGEEEFARIQEE
jgi:hypothetical protein